MRVVPTAELEKRVLQQMGGADVGKALTGQSLASTIVKKAGSCFSQSKCTHVCYEYQECVANFCRDECKDQKECNDICYSEASELFHAFSPQVHHPLNFANTTMLVAATPDQLIREMKQDPLMEHMNNVGQLATSIVQKSQDCFDLSSANMSATSIKSACTTFAVTNANTRRTAWTCATPKEANCSIAFLLRSAIPYPWPTLL
jgi:hypothetical protein